MHAVLIRKDYNEIGDNIVINKLKSILRSQEFFILTDNTQVTFDLIFLRKFVTIIKDLRFSNSLNSNNLQRVIRTLSTSNIKVCFNSR